MAAITPTTQLPVRRLKHTNTPRVVASPHLYYQPKLLSRGTQCCGNDGQINIPTDVTNLDVFGRGTLLLVEFVAARLDQVVGPPHQCSAEKGYLLLRLRLRLVTRLGT